MKILHVPFSYYPDAVGGTEVYVHGLGRSLKDFGISSTIAAPGSHDDLYEHQGIQVYRYALQSEPASLRELYGEGSLLAANSFDRILATEQPNIVHLHALTRGVSLRLVEAAKVRRIPVVFTYHTPTATCQRGTMMRLGVQPCNGLMDLYTCARCTVDGLLGGSRKFRNQVSRSRLFPRRALAQVIGSVPPVLGRGLGRMKLQGGHWTALRMTELVQLRHAVARGLLAEVDHVVAVCQWVEDILISNGVSPHKVTLCRQGVADTTESFKLNFKQSGARSGSLLQLAFLGRLDPNKGLHILIEALRSIPAAQLRLVIYGVLEDESARKYEEHLRRLAAPDPRIEFHPPVPRSAIPATLSNFDFLAVPSQWLETGPLVVLEAFAAGIPVMGSRLGGISELVKDGVDGILVEASKPEAWAASIQRLTENTSLANELRAKIRYPRTMSNVAKDMVGIYRKLLAKKDYSDVGHELAEHL